MICIEQNSLCAVAVDYFFQVRGRRSEAVLARLGFVVSTMCGICYDGHKNDDFDGTSMFSRIEDCDVAEPSFRVPATLATRAVTAICTLHPTTTADAFCARYTRLQTECHRQPPASSTLSEHLGIDLFVLVVAAGVLRVADMIARAILSRATSMRSSMHFTRALNVARSQ